MSPRSYRDVMGQLPTGVTAISAVGEDGSPVGMTLGTFTSVSLDPPLVAFLPARTSSTFPLIKQAGRFCASILASDQKGVAQAFSSKGDRFSGVSWRPAPQTGSPIIDGSLAWVDCTIVDVREAGDHDIVIGRVLDLDMEPVGLPLIFFQGGYGMFTLQSLVLATRGRLSEHAMAAEKLRPELERLSADLGVECRVFARVEQEIIVVMTTGYSGIADRVGMLLPYCAPFGMSFAAWGSPQARDAWFDSAAQTVEPAERARLDGQLDRFRERGWTVSFDTESTAEIGEVLEEMARYGPTPRFERDLRSAGSKLTTDLATLPELNSTNVDQVRSISAPVLRDGNAVLHLVVRGFRHGDGLGVVLEARDRLREIGRAGA